MKEKRKRVMHEGVMEAQRKDCDSEGRRRERREGQMNVEGIGQGCQGEGGGRDWKE